MKAVLVIDTPKNCEECKITYFQGHGESSICYSGDWSKRPSWCPLRPLPEKKEMITDLPQLTDSVSGKIARAFIKGYNACINEITGETE